MDEIENVEQPPLVIAARRHDHVSMSLHWLTLALLIVLFGSIWARDQASDGDIAALLLTLHRSAGVLLWLVTVARLAWKASAAVAPPLPATLPRPQRWMARANEYALYLLLVAQPITGFVQSIARGKPFPLLGFDLPVLMARDKTLTHLFHDLHETSATVLLVLIALHACAAIVHGVFLRDGVLGSMLPARLIPVSK
jgi:cytochrome b561